ncbi:hypothetical protein [Anaeromyxobacter sp. Fw109-5]|uniref:hypothetical protein n=1 Tax=Anaeromyxobacter sp. (strain Fw109-5) TaxID=404589 RepID=UPI0000ED6FED|nr:hypothetical protein [Anaeromyxobacter sp. Fw109-5]
MTTGNQKILFAGLPRRRRLAGLVTVGLWLGICVAFVSDAIPTSSSEDWLYGVEARRDAHARVLAQRAAAQQPAPRRAARATPPAERERRALSIVDASVVPLPSHVQAAVCRP